MFSISSCSIKNTIYSDKPNEDSFFISKSDGVFGVLDGVSRDAINSVYPDPSPSYDASHLISNVISNELALQSKSEKITIEKAISQEKIKMIEHL